MRRESTASRRIESGGDRGVIHHQGELLKIEGATDGAFYTVKDTSGKEVRLHVNKETRMDPALKVGEMIEAQSNTSGHALTIKKPSPVTSGDRSHSGMRGMEP